MLKVPGEPTAYYQPGDTALHWLGTYTDTALVRFDPPLDILDLPCGMYTTWRDSGIAAITGSGRIDIRVTTLEATADAWGTLLMPYGPVEDVLRVRYELNVRSRNEPNRVHLREVRYAWYCTRTPMPLLLVVERSGWPPPERFTRWLDAVSYTHLRAHETVLDLVCRLLLENKNHTTQHTQLNLSQL